MVDDWGIRKEGGVDISTNLETREKVYKFDYCYEKLVGRATWS
jgi:hypothetical protein